MTQTSSGFEFYDHKPAESDVLDEVLATLTTPPRNIPPKFFYDERGSLLFEEITRLPEYYLTRTEMALFDECLPVIARYLDSDWCLVEYGAGSTLKVRKLLEHLRPGAYVPVDISTDHLRAGAEELHRNFPGLDVYPTGADFTRVFALPEVVSELTHVGFFPGSSIGNFEPQAAAGFLGNVASTLGAGGYLILGVDRKKDRAVLEAAYNDSAGVTAAFNLNMLSHLNTLIGADFDVSGFAHRALYNAEEGCIQMFVESLADQEVTIGGTRLTLAAGEMIHTENSYKYHPEEMATLAGSAGFEVLEHFTDAQSYFSVLLLRVCESTSD